VLPWVEHCRFHGVTFDALCCITNMPISRYLEWLIDCTAGAGSSCGGGIKWAHAAAALRVLPEAPGGSPVAAILQRTM
jgi:hypothetical protein